MEAKYIHLLLYRCKRCQEPLAISVMSEECNLERIDGHMLAAAQSNPFGHKRGSLKIPS